MDWQCCKVNSTRNPSLLKTPAFAVLELVALL
jgi:hypothetical protein